MSSATRKSASQLREVGGSRYCLEMVDHWHEAWPDVLDLIDRLGQTDCILVDDEGWLSARQCVTAAFDPAGRVVAQYCFRIEPVERDGKILTDAGKVVVRAKVSCAGEDAGADGPVVLQVLRENAEQHAASLGCREFVA